MPLILTSPETLACCAPGGCGAVHELAAGALEPIRTHAGELTGLGFTCRCGCVMAAPRVSADEAAAVLADPGVAWARRAWRRLRWARERELHLEEALTEAPFADWPVPPGDHTLHLAELWRRLEAEGWPEASPTERERRRRLARALERWPEQAA